MPNLHAVISVQKHDRSDQRTEDAGKIEASIGFDQLEVWIRCNPERSSSEKDTNPSAD
jgi:hypothetical protein